MSEQIIKVENLTKTFESKKDSLHALKNVSFSIEKGDIYGIIGLSGAGKSTLVRCMNLLERPSEGRIIVHGKSLTELSKKELRLERQKIGMIFQHFNLLQQRTVLDNVCLPLELRGIPKKERRQRAMELLKSVGLDEKASSYPSQLSGGQQQRVAIARVLANEPDILLCDEATSALDPQTTKTILDLLLDINQRLGITIVVITHEMRVVQQICKHVAVLDHGVLKETGTVSEVFTNPSTSAAKRLVYMGLSEEEDDISENLSGEEAAKNVG